MMYDGRLMGLRDMNGWMDGWMDGWVGGLETLRVVVEGYHRPAFSQEERGELFSCFVSE